MTEQPIPVNQNFWDNVGEAADRGDSGGANFGKLDIKPGRYVHWVDKEPVEVTPEVFNSLPAKDKSLELVFTVDIQEMNPGLEWTYERNMRPGDKDWHKIFKPALIELLGADSMKAGAYSTTLQSLVGKYVEVHDVPQVKNPEYNTIKIVRIFASKDECFAAYKERFGGTDATGAAIPATAPLSTPPGYTPETWASVVPSIKDALKTTAMPDVAAQYQVEVRFIAEIAGQA